MMRFVSVLFVYFYLLGTFLLPFGNFTILVDLPEMYKHCKAYEDKDMTPFDFITDHLVCPDSLFDSHGNGDAQKSHQPLPMLINPIHQPVFLSFTFLFENTCLVDNHLTYGYIELKHSQRISKSVFHPPVA